MEGGAWKVERRKQRLSTRKVFKMVDSVVVERETTFLETADTCHSSGFPQHSRSSTVLFDECVDVRLAALWGGV